MTNIDHTNCEHERTSKARAKCRRDLASGATTPKAGKASSKEVDFSGSGGAQGTTPRDRWNACDVCGVERAILKGTPKIEKRLLFVGEKCSYYLNTAEDREYLLK